MTYEVRTARKEVNLKEAGSLWATFNTEAGARESAFRASNSQPDIFVAVWAYKDDGSFYTKLLYYPQGRIAA